MNEESLPEVIISTALTDRNIFIEIHNLASKVYDPSIVLPSTILESWHYVNPDIFWTCHTVSDGALVGYICALPLKFEAFQKTQDPDFDEISDIPPSSVEKYEKPGLYRVYFVSIVVHPAFHHVRVRRYEQTISRLLRNSFLASMVALERKAMVVTELSGYYLNPLE
jgi:hypothetical protein